MKKIFLVCLILSTFSVGCNKDSQDIEREEDGYQEDDINPGPKPSNIGDEELR